ncbi:MAG: hypothetical protein Q4E65_07055 [Clostridia bacterium]|nr:hypothetical protein [Clostridia bacterium]
MENKNVELAADQTAQEHKPLGVYALILFNESLLLLSLFALLWLIFAIYQSSFVREPPDPMVGYIWISLFGVLPFCSFSWMTLYYLLHANGKAYRLIMDLFLILIAGLCTNGISFEMDSILFIVISLLTLFFIRRYIYKSKKLKAYFGEE